MSRKNGKADVEEAQLDAEHELPAAEGSENRADTTPAAKTPEHVTELEKLRAERDALIDRLARMQAEFENARKRARREQEDFRDYALVDAIKTLIPVLDSLERALAASPEKSEFHSGVELIHRQLEDALAKIGVRPVAARGERFDPRYHEAIEMVDTDEFEDHQVLEELQRGYKLKDRLLRPAMVKVARNSRR